MKLKSLLYLLTLSLGMVSLSACNDSDDADAPDQPSTPVSTEIMAAFKAKFPSVDVEKDEIEWETKGQYTVADFDMLNGMEDVEAWFDTKTGEWAMTKTDYGENLFLISAPLNAAFYASPYKSWDPGEIVSYEYPDSTRDVFIFEATKTGEPKTDVIFTPDAKYIKAVPHTDAEVTPATLI